MCLWKRLTGNQTEWRRSPSPEHTHILQSVEDKYKQKEEKWKEGQMCFLCSSWDTHLLLPSDICTPGSQAFGFRPELASPPTPTLPPSVGFGLGLTDPSSLSDSPAEGGWWDMWISSSNKSPISWLCVSAQHSYILLILPTMCVLCQGHYMFMRSHFRPAQLLVTLWDQSRISVLAVKNLHAKADMRHVGSIPGSGRSLGEGHDNSLQYSCLENHMDRGAWRATVHSVAKSRTQQKSTMVMFKLVLAWVSYSRLHTSRQ